ncbi:MAG: ABC transporter permease, partial [Candidatus Aminicenantes bacterium]|nr:ABC transporter permease [Candidatus Aminicenantes bacterium]
MFDLESAVRKWKKELRKYEVFEDGLIADIELHLRDAYDDARDKGIDENAAFHFAVKQVGTAKQIAAEYDKNRRVRLNRRSPLRPGRFMPSLAWNYIKSALRAIRRQKGYSFINITGLAIGLAVCMLIVLWVADEWRFDRFHDNARFIHRVYKDESAIRVGSTSALTSPPIAGGLKNDFPEIERVSRFGTWDQRLVTYGDKSFNEGRYMHADPDFFLMFSFPFLKGDPASAFSEPNSVVLSKETAERYFGEEDPLGKTLNVNHTFDVVVTGVIDNKKSNSSLEFELLSPFDLLIKEFIGEDNRNNWEFNSFFTFVQLAENTSAENLNQKIKDWLTRDDSEDTDVLALQPLKDSHLFSNLGHDYRNRGNIKYVWIFS